MAQAPRSDLFAVRNIFRGGVHKYETCVSINSTQQKAAF